MQRHPAIFSPFYVSLIRVGEATGLLEDVFLRLFEHLEFEKESATASSRRCAIPPS